MRTWLYLPTGNKVEFEFSDSSIPEDDYANAMDYTRRLLALGASVTAPGLEAGEEKEQIGAVVRRSKVNDDATETPILDLYLNHDATKYKFLTVYLNTPDDIAAFETASSLKLDSIPFWEGGHLERGNLKTDKYIISLPRPLYVIHRLNERYNPDEPDATKRKPKRLFVRWESVGTPTPLPASQNAPEPAKTGANSSAAPAPAAATGTPKAAENAGNGALPNWFNTPLQTCFGAFKTYILPNLYENNTWHMNGSLKKHGISDGKSIGKEWATKPAGEVYEYLKHRKDEPADNPELLEESA